MQHEYTTICLQIGDYQKVQLILENTGKVKIGWRNKGKKRVCVCMKDKHRVQDVFPCGRTKNVRHFACEERKGAYIAITYVLLNAPYHCYQHDLLAKSEFPAPAYANGMPSQSDCK